MSCRRNVKARHNQVEYADMASIAAIAQILDYRVKVVASEHAVEPEDAIGIVARKFKAGAGTIANIIRCKNGKQRVKSVCFSLGQRIIQAAIEDIERKKKELESEHARLLDLAVNANPAALARAEEGLRITMEALAEMRGRP